MQEVLMTRERVLKWLDSIEQYLWSGDGDWDITDEDREIIAYLKKLMVSLIPTA